MLGTAIQNMTKILVIDPELEVRQLMIQILGPDEQWQVLETADPEGAVKIAREHRDLDWILVDGDFHGNNKRSKMEELVRSLRLDCPQAKLIAMAHRVEWNDLLVQAGCVYKIHKHPCSAANWFMALMGILIRY